MKLRKYTLENLLEAVKQSTSIRMVLNKLQVRGHGGNYQTIKKAIILFNIDISHFTGRGHLKGKTHDYKKRSIEDILIKGKYENTHTLKLRLIREGIKDHRCENSKCGLTHWLGNAIPIELHHLDGDKLNNELSNLQILCANCHATTHNYRGKNKRKLVENKTEKIVKIKRDKKIYKCVDCDKIISEKRRKRCKSCFGKLKNTKINWPNNEILFEMVSLSSYSAVGRQLGVSDNAIRKRLKRKNNQQSINAIKPTF